MNQSPSIQKLTEALIVAQSEMQNPNFDALNPHFKSKYASLKAVRESVLPILNKHGLTLTQFPKSEGSYAGCSNLLAHASGEWLQGESLFPVDKMTAQGAAAAITYARRISMQSIAGVVGEEDVDGNGDGKKEEVKKMAEKQLADFLAAITESASEADLKKSYTAAYKAAQAIPDKDAMAKLTKAKDERKKAIA